MLILASLAGAIEGVGDAGDWLRFTLLAVTLGPLVGVAVGWAGSRGIQKGVAAGWINEPFERLSSLGLAFLAFAGAELVGGNGFIAAFVAGLLLGHFGREVCGHLYDFGETEGQLLTLLVFLVFGAVMVPEALAHASPSTLLYAALSLTLVRMVPVALSLLGSGLFGASFAFVGWFGPRGLASILFVLLVVEPGRLDSGGLLEGIVVLTVLMSALAHGATAYPVARRYGASVTARRAAAEQEASMDLPVRVRHV